MHTIDLLEQTLTVAERAGIQVRREWLGDVPGGLCRIGATRVLYTNLSLSAEEQLQQLVFALRTESSLQHSLPDR